MSSGRRRVRSRGVTWFEILGLALAAAVAGAMNAIAGGGTLVTFPTLLALGTPPVVANATNTLALMIGTVGSYFGYRAHMHSVRRWVWRFVPVSIVGGFLGSLLLTRTSERAFGRLVPFLILFATLVFLGQAAIRRLAAAEGRMLAPGEHRGVWLAIVFQFLVSVYGGYFGAGIGILMLASLAFIGLTDIHEMNALKTLLSSLINLVAAIWFVHAGLVHWPKASVMIAGSLVGYYLGSHSTQRVSQTMVRRMITAIGFAISGITFYREFLR